jgi:hypothetical protein
MCKANQQLQDAMKKLSGAKYGRPRAQVEKEIAERLGPAKPVKPVDKTPTAVNSTASKGSCAVPSSLAKDSSSFLDEWLAKRKTQKSAPIVAKPVNTVVAASNSGQVIEKREPDLLNNKKLVNKPIDDDIKKVQGIQKQPEKQPSTLLSMDSKEEVSVHIR